MLENWCWQPEILGRLSSHFETGEPLPDELLRNMIRAKNVNVGRQTLRQIYLSTMDMVLHTNPPAADKLQELADTLRRDISLTENPPGCTILRSFGHLMNQYGARAPGSERLVVVVVVPEDPGGKASGEEMTYK